MTPFTHLAVLASALSDDPRAAPRIARSLGFTGLQYDVHSAALNLHELSQTGRRDFRHALAAQDQALVSLRVDAGPKGLSTGADVDRVLARLDTAMEVAAGLGPRLLCVDLGPLPAPPPAPTPPAPKPPADAAGLILLPSAEDLKLVGAPTSAPAATTPADERAMAQVDGALAELGRRADRYGVTCAFRSDLASFAALDRALRAARCPHFGLDLDPAALLRDDWPADEAFSRLGPVIRHVRGRDAILGSDRRTQPAVLGRGGINWGQLLADLGAAGFRGPIVIDPLELPDRPSAASAALTFLRALR